MQNFDDLQNVLIKLTVKPSVDKAWLLYYGFSFSLNSGDKPNKCTEMKELFIIISIKYGKPIPSKFKEKLIGNFRDSKIKPTNK